MEDRIDFSVPERIHDFIIQNNVERNMYKNSYELIKVADKKLGYVFGIDLIRYLYNYGYLCFESIEFYGLSTFTGLDSDIINQTLYLHKHFPKTKRLVAFENRGDGDYYLLDSSDVVFEYDTEEDELRSTNQKLFDYILSRFKSVY